MILPSKSNAYGFVIFTVTCILSFFAAAYTEQPLLMTLPFTVLFFYYGWQHLKFILFFLLFSLPWSVEYSFNHTLGTDLPDEPLMLFVSLLFLVNLINKPSLIGKQDWRHPLLSVLLIHVAWIAVTVPFSS